MAEVPCCSHAHVMLQADANTFSKISLSTHFKAALTQKALYPTTHRASAQQLPERASVSPLMIREGGAAV